MELVTDLQDILRHLQQNPTDFQPHSLELPVPLEKEMRGYVVGALGASSDRLQPRSLLAMLSSGELRRKLSHAYGVLLDVGVEDQRELRRLLRVFVDHTILSCLPEDVHPADKAILEHIATAHRYPSRWAYLIEYARQNHLIHWCEGRWRVTQLGRMFLRMPPFQAVRFLLTVEHLLNVGPHDEWHMTKGFLRLFMEEHERQGYVDDKTFRDRPGKFYQTPSQYEYVERLWECGMIYRNREERSYRLTEIGRAIVASLLTVESGLDTVVELLLQELISDRTLPSMSSPNDAQRLQQLIESSPVVVGQKEALLKELRRLRQVAPDYLSSFKGLAPCIEGLLRNLVNREKLHGDASNIYGLVKTVRAGPGILSESTLQMVDSVVRPYRNIVEHGHVIAPEPARMLCEIALAVIEQIDRDYGEYLKRKQAATANK